VRGWIGYIGVRALKNTGYVRAVQMKSICGSYRVKSLDGSRYPGIFKALKRIVFMFLQVIIV